MTLLPHSKEISSPQFCDIIFTRMGRSGGQKAWREGTIPPAMNVAGADTLKKMQPTAVHAPTDTVHISV